MEPTKDTAVVRVLARPQLDGHELAVIDDGEHEWFAASQASEAIGHANRDQIAKNLAKASYAAALIEGTDYRRAEGDDPYLVAAKVAGIVPPNTPNLLLLSRSGLDIVAMLARTETARRFRRWLADEVLPSIRSTGGYGLRPAPETNEDRMARLLGLAMLEQYRLDYAHREQGLTRRTTSPPVENAAALARSVLPAMDALLEGRAILEQVAERYDYSVDMAWRALRRLEQIGAITCESQQRWIVGAPAPKPALTAEPTTTLVRR